MVAVRANSAVADRLARSARSCGLGPRAAFEEARPLCRRLGPLERDVERRDLRQHSLDLAVEGVERFLEIVDLDVLAHDRAQGGKPGDGVARSRRRNPERDGCTSVLAGRVLDRDDVPAEVTCDREGLLRRSGERVRVLDGERQIGAVALRAAGERPRRAPSARRWPTRRPTGPRRPRRPTGWSIAAPLRAGSTPHGRWSRVARRRSPRRRRPRAPPRPGRRGPAVAGGETARGRTAPRPAAPTRPSSPAAGARRSRSGARRGAGRRSRSRSSLVHPLLESFQCPAEPGRDCGRADAEHAGCGVAVELEDDPQRDHLALTRAQRRERRLELG